MQLGISEILAEAEKAPTREEKVAVLRRYKSNTLVGIICSAYDERVEWDLPKETPNYRPGPATGAESALYAASKRLYLFLKDTTGMDTGAPSNLTQMKKQQLFVQILESIDPLDAELLLACVNKRLPHAYASLTREVFDDAWPETLAYDRSKQHKAPVQTTQIVLPNDATVMNQPKRSRGRPKGTTAKAKATKAGKKMKLTPKSSSEPVVSTEFNDPFFVENAEMLIHPTTPNEQE